MTRRFCNLFVLTIAFFLAAQLSLRAGSADAALAKSYILESNIAYLRISRVETNLLQQIQSAQKNLTATNKIVGTVLDLRFAEGEDVGAAKAVSDLFTEKKFPLVILVNGETRGAAETLAAALREAHDGLVFGSAVAELKPDIAVAVNARDEKSFLENPYATLALGETNSSTASNNFAPLIDHTSEADLVREKIKDGSADENPPPPRPAEPQKPFIHDPVLARAVDLIKALAIVRQSRL